MAAEVHSVEAGMAPDPPLRARTLEILWHYSERNEEAEQMGMQGGNLVEGVTSIDYCYRNGRVVTTGGDKCIRMWQMKHPALHAWLRNRANDMAACALPVCTMRTAWMPVAARWSPHGELVATAHCDGKLCLWWRDRNSGLYRGNADSTEDSVEVLVQSGGGVVSVGGPSGVGGGVPRAEEWKDYKHLTGHMSDVYDVAFSPDSRHLVSGAGDGTVLVHDLEGSTMPVVQLLDQHSKFCRGVAWDPWGSYVHSFGGGPALQCYQAVAPRTAHGRLHLVNQRRCQGDFLGESCSLNSRRLSWSPDGLLLAAPYGKAPLRRKGAASRGRAQEASIFAAIDAKRSAGAATAAAVVETGTTQQQQQPPLKAARTEEEENASARPEGVPEAHHRGGSKKEGAGTRSTSAGCTPSTGEASDVAVRPMSGCHDDNEDDDEEEEEEAMIHCVNIYTRDALDKLAARLCIKGYNEIRGVRWAPCFLEPLPPLESYVLVGPPSSDGAGAMSAAEGGTPPSRDVGEAAGSERRRSRSRSRPLSACRSPATGADDAGAAERNGTRSAAATTTTEDDAARPLLMTVTTPVAAGAAAAAAGASGGAWGPVEYRMALAVWTTEAVMVYTTDSPHRHSDFSDLHMRSISDVAWSSDAALLFTASLDGYVSVMSFGQSLTPAHRLPMFCDRPAARSLCAVLEGLSEAGRALEGARSSCPAPATSKVEGSSTVPTATAPAIVEGGEESGSGHGGGEEVLAKPAVAVVRKKKKVAQDDVGVEELAAMMGDTR